MREEYRVPHLRRTPARRDEAVTGDCVRARSGVVSREKGGATAGVVGQVGQRRRLQYDTAGHIMPRAGDAPAREGVGSCLDGNASATCVTKRGGRGRVSSAGGDELSGRCERILAGESREPVCAWRSRRACVGGAGCDLKSADRARAGPLLPETRPPPFPCSRGSRGGYPLAALGTLLQNLSSVGRGPYEASMV